MVGADEGSVCVCMFHFNDAYWYTEVHFVCTFIHSLRDRHHFGEGCLDVAQIAQSCLYQSSCRQRKVTLLSGRKELGKRR